MTETITGNLKNRKGGQQESSSQDGQDSQNGKGALSGITSQLPIDRLKQEAQGLGQALVKQGFSRASGGVESLTGRLNDFAQGSLGGAAPKLAKNLAEGDSPAKAGVKAAASKVTDKVKDKLGGLGGGGGNKIKVTNILESVDVPVSREVAYEQWTQFEDFPTFMKKVENVKQEEDEKLTWKAQIFWSHRSWNAEIVDQVPNERVVWKSEGEKGHVDGAVTFHELAPDLTRVQVVLEYHPKGLFEHTGNLWRAQGRRARLELKHFARHVSIQTILHQDELEGWKGEIHDGHVVEGSASQDGDRAQDQGDQPEGRDRNRKDRGDRAKPPRSKRHRDEDDADEDAGEQGSGKGDRQAKAARRPQRRSGSAKATKTAEKKRPRRATAKASAR